MDVEYKLPTRLDSIFQQNMRLEQNNIYAFRTTPKACVIRKVQGNEFRQITFLDYIMTVCCYEIHKRNSDALVH